MTVNGTSFSCHLAVSEKWNTKRVAGNTRASKVESEIVFLKILLRNYQVSNKKHFTTPKLSAWAFFPFFVLNLWCNIFDPLLMINSNLPEKFRSATQILFTASRDKWCMKFPSNKNYGTKKIYFMMYFVEHKLLDFSKSIFGIMFVTCNKYQ